jgi:hypothetical protein
MGPTMAIRSQSLHSIPFVPIAATPTLCQLRPGSSDTTRVVIVPVALEISTFERIRYSGAPLASAFAPPS